MWLAALLALTAFIVGALVGFVLAHVLLIMAVLRGPDAPRRKPASPKPAPDDDTYLTALDRIAHDAFTKPNPN